MMVDSLLMIAIDGGEVEFSCQLPIKVAFLDRLKPGPVFLGVIDDRSPTYPANADPGYGLCRIVMIATVSITGTIVTASVLTPDTCRRNTNP